MQDDISAIGGTFSRRWRFAWRRNDDAIPTSLSGFDSRRAGTARRGYLVTLLTVTMAAVGGCSDSSGRADRAQLGHDGSGGQPRGAASGGTGGNGGSGGTSASAGSEDASASAGHGGTSASGGMGGVVFIADPGSHCSVGDLPFSANTLKCGGLIHRVSSNACPLYTPSDRILPASGLTDECLSDRDCTAKSSGACENTSGNGGHSGNVCRYLCSTDGDCGSGSVCDCFNGRCVVASCVTDSSCAPGKLCRETVDGYSGGFSVYSFRCQTIDDTCRTSADCAQGNECRWAGDRFACLSSLPIP